MIKKSFQQICEDNWPEDEAFGCYMEFSLGWRKNPDLEEDDYRLRRQLDIDFYTNHVFNKEVDRDQLIARFIIAYDEIDQEYKNAEPDDNV